MDFQKFKEAVLLEAEKLLIKEYELYTVESSKTEFSAYKDEIDEFLSDVKVGACFRCIIQGKMGYAATELFTEEQAASIVNRAVLNARVVESEDEVYIYGAGDNYHQIEKKEKIPQDTDVLREVVLDVQKEIYKVDDRISDGTQTQVNAIFYKVNLFNSKGLDLENCFNIQVLSAYAILKEKGEMYIGDVFDMSGFDKMDRKGIAKIVVNKAIETIDAEVVESGNYQVIFDQIQASTLLQVFSSIFSSDATQKGMSLLHKKEGEKIASDLVSIVDNPFYQGSQLQMAFDAEGVATYEKEIIKNGVLKTLLYNLKTGNKGGVKSTGNASKAGYASSIGISPFHFYFEPGKNTIEELFTIAGDGLYVTGMSGIHSGADAITGDFSLKARGFLIQDGKKGKPVNGITIAGNFYEVLKNITGIANDLKFDYSDSFSVYGAPSILVSELSIAGK